MAPEPAPAPDPEPDPAPETEITFNVLSRYSAFDSKRVAFVAYQEGDGEWKSMPGEGGVYKARITSTRYGVAVGCSPRELLNGGTASDVVVHQATVGETRTISESRCYTTEIEPPPPVTRMIRVMPSGLVDGEFGAINLMNASLGTFNNEPMDVSVVPGQSPVFASILRFINGRGFVARVKRLPDIDLATATSLAVDFGQTIAPISWPLTLPAGAPVDSVTSSVRRGANFGTPSMLGTATEFQSVPASELREGDSIRIMVSTDDGGMNGRQSFFWSCRPPAPHGLSGACDHGVADALVVARSDGAEHGQALAIARATGWHQRLPDRRSAHQCIDVEWWPDSGAQRNALRSVARRWRKDVCLSRSLGDPGVLGVDGLADWRRGDVVDVSR